MPKRVLKRDSPKQKKEEVRSILIAEATILAIALFSDWNLGDIFLAYLLESLVIIFFYFLVVRRLDLRGKGGKVYINGDAAPKDNAAGIIMILHVLVFTMFFGGVILDKINVGLPQSLIGQLAIFSSICTYFFHHRGVYHKKIETLKRQAKGKVKKYRHVRMAPIMLRPYLRLIPVFGLIFVTPTNIINPDSSVALLVVFTTFKVCSDLLDLYIEKILDQFPTR